MSRAKWKPINSLSEIELKILKESGKIKRSVVITDTLINLDLFIHSGNHFKMININEDKIYHKLGEFVFTRSLMGEVKKEKLKKKLIKKKKKK